jgi:predicted nucleic acid-binding protein
MKRIFIDTSAFYALADKKEPLHRKARNFLEGNTLPLVTTNYVFAETLSLLTKRLGKKTAIAFGNGIWESAIINLVFFPEEYQSPTWDLFCSKKDKEWDFIDCSCFVFMEKMGIIEAFSFDKHFSQAGFEMLP